MIRLRCKKGKDMSKDAMLEYLLLKYNYTVSEYDCFFNKYGHLRKESIRQIYEKAKSDYYKNRHHFEIEISRFYDDEKRRLHVDH